MSYGQPRNSGIYRMRNYEDALKTYNDTTPIRGRDNVRPLGHRSKVDAYQIRVKDKTVECVLYVTPVVTYHEEGTITLCAGNYLSQSTCYFIIEVLGIDAYINNHKFIIALQGKAYELKLNGKLTLQRNEQGQLITLDAPKQYTYRIRRKVHKEVKVRYAQMRDFIVGTAKLKEGQEMETEELVEIFGKREQQVDGYKYLQADIPALKYNNPETVEQMFTWLESEPYKAFCWLHNASTYWRVTVKNIEEVFDTCVLARHKDEVLTKKEVPEGVMCKNKHAFLFA